MTLSVSSAVSELTRDWNTLNAFFGIRIICHKGSLWACAVLGSRSSTYVLHREVTDYWCIVGTGPLIDVTTLEGTTACNRLWVYLGMFSANSIGFAQIVRPNGCRSVIRSHWPRDLSDCRIIHSTSLFRGCGVPDKLWFLVPSLWR